MLALLSAREVSARELTEQALCRAHELQPVLNPFVVLDDEGALAAADSVDRARAAREPVGRLAGVPTTVKDLIDVKNMCTTFGSRTSPAEVREADAPSVERLRAAGTTILGKTTTTEFGCKAGASDSPLTGITRNVWDPKRTTGGSSAGAATSVAAGVTPFALGTDGGGSVRVPSALCGTFGIKAQFGRVPVHPVSATPTLGHVGVIARSVRDAALALETISGYDARDPFSVSAEVPDWGCACGGDVSGLRIAWSPTLGYARPSPEVLAATTRAVEQLEAEGACVELQESVIDDPIDLWMGEFYAGVGVRLKDAMREQPELIDPAVLAVLRDAVDAQTLEQYYTRVFERYAFRDRVRQMFEEVDMLLSPTLPVTAFPLNCEVPPGHEDRNIVSWVYYTYPFNLTGNPAASIPCGTDATGLPVGLQAVARRNREADLFTVAAAIERIAPWADRSPLQ